MGLGFGFDVYFKFQRWKEEFASSDSVGYFYNGWFGFVDLIVSAEEVDINKFVQFMIYETSQNLILLVLVVLGIFALDFLP